MKTFIRKLFFPLIITARLLSSFVIWLMEDDTSFVQAWKDTNDY